MSTRLIAANQWLESWASCGRMFFQDEYFYMKGRYLYFHIEWNTKEIYVNRLGPWRGFHHGGTLKSIIWFLSKRIRDKSDSLAIAGNLRYNNITGYGKDIEMVIQDGIRLGIVSE